MQTQPLKTTLPIPDVDVDEPVAVIPAASVAPLDGAPDGERINVYAIAPQERGRGADALAQDMLMSLRDTVQDKPLTCALVAFSLGYVFARLRG